MYVEIYIDILFLINFIMDFIILYFTNKIFIKKDIPIKKIIFAAIVGALGVCCLIFIDVNKILKFIFTYIIINLFMIKIAFNPKTLISSLKYVIFVYIITFIVGGILNISYNNNSLYRLIILILITLIVLKVLEKLINNINIPFKKFYKIKIIYESKKVYANGLMDTGNFLETASNKPIIIAEYDLIKDIIPKNISDFFYKYYNFGILNLEDKELMKKIRYIPYSTIGKKDGLLLGVVANNIEIYTDEFSIINDKIIVAVYYGNLTKNKSYQVILHKNLLSGRKKKDV